MRVSTRSVLSKYVIFLFYFLVAIICTPATSSAQTTPTTIQVTGTVLQHSVKRLGINLGDQSYWDSGQMVKNLVFGNAGFEGMKYRSILECTAVTANTCQDANQYTPQGTDFWTGGTYRVISGASAGHTGSIVRSVNNRQSCGGCGQIVTFDSNLSLAVGDYVIVTNSMPGNAQERWWTSTSGNATLATEFNDLSPETQGKQALRVTASGSGDSASIISYWDAMDNYTFLQMNGHYRLSFRAKGVGGSNKVSILLQRQAAGEPIFLQQTVTLNSSWTDYNLDFTANETNFPVGHIQLAFQFSGSSALLDDVSVTQTDSDPQNTTAFRDDVVNTLKDLHPGVLRMNAGAAIGVDLYDEIAPPMARYREGTVTSSDIATDIPYGLTEFLQLCAAVGADPWITIPTATTPQELTDFMDYLQGSGSTTYSAIRASQGQVAPWTSVFSKIYIELGNETWNGVFAGETMAYPAYPQWANQVFGAARKSPGFDPSKFDFVLDGWSANPGYNKGILQYSTQHDSIDIAPYLMYSANDIPMANQFQAAFAEPEMFDSAGGSVYQNFTLANSTLTSASGTSRPTNLHVYEVNISTSQGSITQAEAKQFVPSLGAGLSIADHMLQMMRLGVGVQNGFALPGFRYTGSNGNSVALWGFVVDMGTKLLRRPSFLAEALANTAIQGDMLQTVQGGANPIWNQPLSSDNVQYPTAHEIQSFAFLNGSQHSLVLFNLSLTNARPVTFSGANAPSGTVQVSRLTSANITDNNETSDTVQVSNSTATISASTPYSLPPYSMTVLSWGGSGSETPQTAAPVFSPAPGTYSGTQSVTISDATSGATIYYTTDGSTPTTSSTKYTGAISVTATKTIHAIAVLSGNTNSTVTSGTYTINSSALPAPVFSPAAGTYTSAQIVSISDATSGTTIYYTTNGSVPTTSSAKYTGPISVGTTETLSAIAVKSGSTNSPVAAAKYTISPVLPVPVFSMASGSYVGTQSVALSDATSGATIYYTTNGATPTTSSTKYTGPISVSATTTIHAIAAATGYTNSPVATASYTITEISSGNGSTGPSSGDATINFAGGFSGASSLSLNGSAAVSGSQLRLTNGSQYQASSAWYGTPVNIQSFTTDFTFQIVNPVADGMTFAIQNAGPKSIGPTSGNLGYGYIGSSVAVKFDLFDNKGEGANSTGFYTNGAMPMVPAIDLTPSGVNLHSGDMMQAHIVYNGSTLSLTITDTTTKATFTTSTPINIPATVGGNTAYVGFTGGTGYSSSTQNVLSWSFSSSVASTTPALPAPTFSLAAGSYIGTQSVTISDAIAGATIYYTTDGSTPTTSSMKYSGAISIGASETITAIAVKSGYTNSPAAVAKYVIGTAPAGNVINFANGFANSPSSIVLNGNAKFDGTRLQLTDGKQFENSSAWYGTAVNVQSFTTDIGFQIASNATGDGFTFAIQGVGPHTMGSGGAALGYENIPASVGLKIDIHNNGGEGPQSTGLYINGAKPYGTAGSVSLTSSGIDLLSGHAMALHLAYDGKNLAMTLTDTVTKASFTHSFAVNIPSVVGGKTAYVGFTGASGGDMANQEIVSWGYSN